MLLHFQSIRGSSGNYRALWSEKSRIPAIAVGVLLLAVLQAGSAQPDLAIPTPEQAAWQDLEIGMFIHYDFWAFKHDVKQWHWKDVSPDFYCPR